MGILKGVTKAITGGVKYGKKALMAGQTVVNAADTFNAAYSPTYGEDEALSNYAADDTTVTGKITGTERLGKAAIALLNQDWFDLAKVGFDALIAKLSVDPLPFDVYLAVISQYIDAKIMQFSQDEQLRFVGGECFLDVVTEEKVVKTNAKLYFKNTANKWILKELNGSTTFNNFTAEMFDGEITDIMNDGGRKFPITAPEN